MIKQISKYLFFCLLILLLTKCNYRTSSQERFSNILDIAIPKDAEILKDEYQDMWQDFSIVYELKLTMGQMSNLTQSVRKSGFYNPTAFVTDFVNEDMYVEKGDKRAVWARTKSGYIFQNEFGRDIYSAKIDTINRVAEFNEFHD